MESKKCLLYDPFLFCVYAKRLIQMLLINTIMLISSDFEFNYNRVPPIHAISFSVFLVNFIFGA